MSMCIVAKEIFLRLPLFLKRMVVRMREQLGKRKALKQLRLEKKDVSYVSTPHGGKKNILFYHISGLSFGGTEKNLQILARHLNKERYNVYFMYSPKPRGSSGGIRLDGRAEYVKSGDVELIEFDYASMDSLYPYVVHGMCPSVFEVLREKNIDLLVTAGSGYNEFPFNLINAIPIILINIFASPLVQKNVAKSICISQEVKKRVSQYVGEKGLEVMYIPTEGPLSDSFKRGIGLRSSLGLSDNDIVFGRIGRADDGIFDPIGIRAFQKIVQTYPQAHYLIMSPPPILRKIVEDERIPHVHFLDPSFREEDVWAFYAAIDVLAHFRADGESFGLNIAEAMLSKKPVITHRSRLWNAHLEYLDNSFSRVAGIDDADAYASFMEEFVSLKKEGKLAAMGDSAYQKGAPLFLIQNNIGTFEQWIDSAFSDIPEI